MHCEIEIDESVIDKIDDEWHLPDRIVDELSNRLDSELASDPVRYLQPLVAPVKTSQYTCRIPDPAARIVHNFLFRVR